MSTLKEELAILIGKYGINDVHDQLMNRMSLEYRYLKKIFEVKETKNTIVENKVKVAEKKVVEEKVADEKVVEEKVAEEEKKEENVEEQTKKFKDSKEQKVWQKEMEDKKRKELEEKGISPKTLLTKENLKKWIEEEGRTYSYIAREYTGTRDYDVSTAAKLYGIENTRKNLRINLKK